MILGTVPAARRPNRASVGLETLQQVAISDREDLEPIITKRIELRISSTGFQKTSTYAWAFGRDC
ncbi:hypothetical protein DL239_15485 [Sedimentitalea sp. CY04]|uniref:Uncharacterized protein n=1 Tax=Parasedimentitalea denitrificans TaxID=2211118 RepID=A0ABX0WC65_9RHOB|nr:hypothetical protein [Sedimentitalea sp. CY04]